MKQITLLIACIFCLISCKKDKKKYTIKGTLLKSCDNPVSNLGLKGKLVFTDDSKSRSSDEDFSKDFVTDQNGFFSVTYDEIDLGAGLNNFELEFYGDSSGIASSMESLPINVDSDLGNLFPFAPNRQIVLKSVGSFTNLDTLVIYPEPSKSAKIAGPFYEGQIISGAGASHYSKFSTNSNKQVAVILFTCKFANQPSVSTFYLESEMCGSNPYQLDLELLK